MERKIRWDNNDDKDHYFNKNLTTNNWDEIENNKIIDTFQIQTYDSNKIVLYSEISSQYVELSYHLARKAFLRIEYLDNNENVYRGTLFDNLLICGISAFLLDDGFRIVGSKLQLSLI